MPRHITAGLPVGACMQSRLSHACGMFVVTEDDAAAIRATFEREGELSAAIELRRRFPLIPDNATARQHVRMIAGWQPIPVTPRPATRPRPGKKR